MSTLSAHDEQKEYVSSGFFVLRTPLLPIEKFLKLTAAADRASMRQHLWQWAERPEVMEALWLASPDFLQSLSAWREDAESAKGRKLELALYRYFARMTARATPFGAFAGCSTGEIADVTHLELAPLHQYRRSTRMDMEYLCSLAEVFTRDSARRWHLRFRGNGTLHLAAGRYHHVRERWHEGEHLCELVATDRTPIVDSTLLRATAGATVEELASAVVADDPAIMLQEADAFVARLIESQLLISEIVPPVTGTCAIGFMADQLERAQASGPAAELHGIAAELHALDLRGIGADTSSYDTIVTSVQRLGGTFTPGRLVQVDLNKPVVAATLDRRLLPDIVEAIKALHSICDSSQNVLDSFMDEFRERYGEQEVPLLEALDDEAGIGFENQDNPTSEPLIAGMDFRRAPEFRPSDNPAAEGALSEGGETSPILVRLLEELKQRNEMVLALDAAILHELRVADTLPLPDAFAVMGRLFRDADGNEGFHLQAVLGPSGVNLLARLCHTDERLAQCVQDHIDTEERLQQDSGVVFAEIAHLPEGRVGNVVSRPALRQYEIALLATPGVSPGRQIALSDLTVSVHDGRIVLRSRRLGREVLPRLTTAHNFASPRSLKLYKFLCLLQHQGRCAELFWDWGAARQSDFLPRVVLGNTVLSLAKWKINQETAQALLQRSTPLRQWREQNRVPRFVLLAESDHHLLIDFENPLAVETFFDHLDKQPETLLVEMFPAPDAQIVRGPEGSFVHEMILPFVRPHAVSDTIPMTSTAAVELSHEAARSSASTIDGDLEPKSEWLFVKLYCSPSHADRLLLEGISPLVKEVMAGAADGWFFLRYGDPGWHVRLRFHGAPLLLRDDVLPAIRRMAKLFHNRGILWRVRFDHYEPEIERYGGVRAIKIAEELFRCDSELCLALLPLVQSDATADLRWQLAFCGADRLLAGLGFDLGERKTLAEQMRAGIEQFWIVDEAHRRQLSQKFRSGQMRQTLTTLLHTGDEGIIAEGIFPPEAVTVFQRFSRQMEGIRARFGELEQQGTLTSPLAAIAQSLVHMHVNRMLRSCHHEQETVLYDFLSRTYAARLAREE